MNSKELKKDLDALCSDGSFSGNISIYRKNCLLYENSFGFSNRQSSILINADTSFGIASGTKTLTALGIGRLIDSKKLDFETPLSECVSIDFPHFSNKITIGNLLNHTSGVYDYLDEELIQDFDNFKLDIPNSKLLGPKDYLPMFQDKKMKFRPGERFSYSNSGYIILGIVIEEVTGFKYQKFIEDQILAPLGMRKSGFFSLDNLPVNTALGYIGDKNSIQSNKDKIPIIGASDGGMFSSTGDLKILWKNLFSDKILTQKLKSRFIQESVKCGHKDPNKGYGYGFWLRDSKREGSIPYLMGCDAGVSMVSQYLLKTDAIITVLSNTSTGAWPVVKLINQMVLSDS